MDSWKEALKRSQIPEYMRGGIERWIEWGVKPGSFLTAVLRNDLRGAFGQADDVNTPLIREYVVYLYCHAPSPCWGSEKNFNSWRGLTPITPVKETLERE